MRKIFSTTMLVAAAAMTFASCQREEMNAPKETFSTILTLNTDVEATKTYLGSENTVLWGENEAVTLFVKDSNDEPETKFVTSAETSDFDGKASASFSFELTDLAESVSYTIGGVYPASASKGIENTNASAYKIALPATQNSSVDNYDPSAFIMLLKPETVETIPSTYTASFRRAVALNKITLTGVKENISSVEITVPEGKYLAGRRYFNLITGEPGNVYEGGGRTNTVNINSSYSGNSIEVWFTSWGVELAAGDELTIKMTSASKTYTRTIEAREEGIKFVEGDLNTLTVNMSSAEEETSDNYSGEYLVVAKKGDNWALMKPDASTYISAFTTDVAYTSKDCASFYEVKDIDNYVWTAALVDGGYTLSSFDGKYVSYPDNGENHATLETSPVIFGLEIDDAQKAIVTCIKSGRTLKYNSSSPRFAFYASGQADIYFIPWVTDTTPRIFVDNTEYSVEADEGTVDLSYTINALVTGEISVSVKDGSTMVINTQTITSDKVSVNYAANEDSEQKTATIILSYEGAESKEIIITQAAAGGLKEYTVTYTPTSTTAVSVSGDAPETSTATFKNTYTSNKQQITKDNSQTYTLSGYSGCVIKSVTLSMHANSNAGAGTFSLKAGNTDLAEIATATTFNKWYNNTSYGSEWRDVNVVLTNDTYVVEAGENVVLVLSGTTNSIYCESVTITYVNAGTGGETPEPEEPGVNEYTAEITLSTYGSWSSYADRTGTVLGTDNKNYAVAASSICMIDNNKIQARKTKGSVIYNTASFGNIRAISIEDATAAEFTVTVGNSKDACTTTMSSNDKRKFSITADGNGFFKIVNSDSTIAQIVKITVTYTS